jgi:hypothetical protein
MLLHLAPSPVTRLHRAIALRYTAGPQAALAELDPLAAALDRYHLYHATRAEFLHALGQPDQAAPPTAVPWSSAPTPPSRRCWRTASAGAEILAGPVSIRPEAARVEGERPARCRR